MIPTSPAAPDTAVAALRPAKDKATRANTQFDTALGWRPGFGVATLVRILICAVVLFVFAAPFITIISGAFDASTDSTRVSLFPNNPSLLPAQVAADDDQRVGEVPPDALVGGDLGGQERGIVGEEA
ncbi:hypothetical protein C5C27_12140, partial [Rathayibacter sp. AY2B7]